MSHAEAIQVVGLAGYALALAAGAATLVSRLIGGSDARRRAWAGVAALVAALAVTGLRTEGIPLGGFVRGMVGDLSITAILVLAAALSTALTGRVALDGPSRTALLAGAAVAGAVLYPMTLGLSRVDPYALGYRPRVFLALIAVLVALSWWHRRGAAVVLAAGVCAFNLRALESVNLWDYLLDPALVVAAWALLAWRGARALTSRRRPSGAGGGRPPAPGGHHSHGA